MSQLRVWFYDPALDADGMLNKLVASLDQPFCHTELEFSDGVACSIYMGAGVSLRARTFDPANYTCVRLQCAAEGESRARARAVQLVADGVSFSTLQMTTCVLWPVLAHHPQRTFCSKLVFELLQAAEVLPAAASGHRVTPSVLHRLLVPVAARAPPRAMGVSTALGFRE